MKIAVVSSPLIKVPPDNYGGIERICYWLARGLVKNGHEVHLFGRTGSYLDGGIVHHYEGNEDSGYADLVLEKEKEYEYDIIHDITHDKIFSARNPQYNNKTINTLQGMARRGPNTTCISRAQRLDLGYGDHTPVVYQGIPLDEYYPIDNPTRDYFLYMGSINDYKGVDIAIDVCRRTSSKLMVAGVAWDPLYNKTLVEPYFDGERIIWLGELGGSEKLSVIQNARALLHPVRWTEPGAIIVGEAFACGVPVIGSDNGVLPELISPATGFICEVQHFDSYPKMAGGCYDINQFTHAIENIDSIDRNACRQYAELFLSDSRMTYDYLLLYQRILNSDYWN